MIAEALKAGCSVCERRLRLCNAVNERMYGLASVQLYNAVNERKYGLASVLEIKCSACGTLTDVPTSKQHGTGAYDVNTKEALGRC